MNKEQHQQITGRLSMIEQGVKELRADIKKLPEQIQGVPILLPRQQTSQTSSEYQQGAQQAFQQAIQYAILQLPVQQAIENTVQQIVQQQPLIQQYVQQAINSCVQQSIQNAVQQALQAHGANAGNAVQNGTKPQQQVTAAPVHPTKERTTLTIFVLRDESARSCFPSFSSSLQTYLNELPNSTETPSSGILSWWRRADRPSFSVREVAGIDKIDKEGTVLICGFSGSVRMEAGSMIFLRELILRKGSQRVEFVVFRFGENANPAKLLDANEKELPTHSIHFNSEGLLLVPSSIEAIKAIVAPSTST